MLYYMQWSYLNDPFQKPPAAPSLTLFSEWFYFAVLFLCSALQLYKPHTDNLSKKSNFVRSTYWSREAVDHLFSIVRRSCIHQILQHHTAWNKSVQFSRVTQIDLIRHCYVTLLHPPIPTHSVEKLQALGGLVADNCVSFACSSQHVDSVYVQIMFDFY